MGFEGSVYGVERFAMSRGTFPIRRQVRRSPTRLIRILRSAQFSLSQDVDSPLNDLYGIIESLNGSSSSYNTVF